MNTLEYNVGAEPSFIGPEAERQFAWIEQNLKFAGNRKFLMTSHIYAGARLKHGDKVGANDLW